MDAAAPQKCTNIALAIQTTTSYFSAMQGPSPQRQTHRLKVAAAMRRGCTDAPVVPASLPARIEPLVRARLPREPRAVLFDIYGTLVYSASGEVGSVAERATAVQFAEAFRSSGLGTLDRSASDQLRSFFFEGIRAEHEELRRGREGDPARLYPEVDIRQIWNRAVSRLPHNGPTLSAERSELLAACYEASINPVSPMPNARATIEALSSALILGIVSNAQFYTRYLFEACFGRSMDQLGFDPRACAFSYEHLRAKPDPLLFVGPLAYLRERGIDSTEVLYVGNDMRNDVASAASVGCMTALFAGDERSLRLREDDPMTRGIIPTTVVDSLGALVGLVRPEEERS
ncbi:MAG: HAD family hydrolase [Spirochaetales bacterium]